MYKTILVPLENTPTDETILTHIRPLARLLGSSLVLMHVADGHVARNQKQLNLEDSQEIRDDREYLARRERELAGEGFSVRVILESGNPAAKLAAAAEREGADLIAMATHGHTAVTDLILGSVASALRHTTRLPVLMIRR